MSTPQPRSSRKPINLAKMATILAVVLGIAFGLCTAAASGSSSANRFGPFAGYMVVACVVIEGLCVLGLFGVGLAAIARSIDSKE